MKRSYNIYVDCANCANKIESMANNVTGVNNAVLNFMTQKLLIDFSEDADKASVIKQIGAKGKKIDSDFRIEA